MGRYNSKRVDEAKKCRIILAIIEIKTRAVRSGEGGGPRILKKGDRKLSKTITYPRLQERITQEQSVGFQDYSWYKLCFFFARGIEHPIPSLRTVHSPGSRDLSSFKRSFLISAPLYDLSVNVSRASILPPRNHHGHSTAETLSNATAIGDASKLTSAYTTVQAGVTSVKQTRVILCEG